MRDGALGTSVAVVATAGLALAAYLTYVHYEPTALVCTGGGGCETVQESSYAEILGIPVALLGLVAYATILALVLWDTPGARTLVAVLALTAAGFSAYLVALQAFVIDAWCVWCLVNDLAVVPLLVALAVARALRTSGS
jgi:uncharacterized membrane protein